MSTSFGNFTLIAKKIGDKTGEMMDLADLERLVRGSEG
ncbi:hypothetical protein TAM4_2335 [Thermococcus sp. AM4]|nr:hypothetical protein TAM4_2335 [Thermococcus sp. AM4]